MSSAAARLHGLVMLLYPAEFRRRYRDDMLQVLVDRQRHEDRRVSLVLLEEMCDAVRTAPRLRWECPVNRTVIVVVAGTVAVAAALVAKVVLLPFGLLVAAAWLFWGRHARPVAPAGSHRWMRWLLAGLLALFAAVAIPAIDGGELNDLWWTVMAIALLSGIAMTITGVVLATSHRAHRGLAPPQ